MALTIMLETGDINRFPGVGSYASYCRCVDSRRMSNHKSWTELGTEDFFGALKARGELQCCKAFALILMSYLQGCNVCRFCRSTKTVIYRDVMYAVFAGAQKRRLERIRSDTA